MSFYRSCVINLSQLTAGMNSQILKKKSIWTETMEKCWEIRKEKFVKDKIRAYPSSVIYESVEVATYFAAIFSQKQNAEEKFIAAARWKTTKHEEIHPSLKGELAAAIFVIRNLEHLLWLKKFRLITYSLATWNWKPCSKPGKLVSLAFLFGKFSIFSSS